MTAQPPVTQLHRCWNVGQNRALQLLAKPHSQACEGPLHHLCKCPLPSKKTQPGPYTHGSVVAGASDQKGCSKDLLKREVYRGGGNSPAWPTLQRSCEGKGVEETLTSKVSRGRVGSKCQKEVNTSPPPPPSSTSTQPLGVLSCRCSYQSASPTQLWHAHAELGGGHRVSPPQAGLPLTKRLSRPPCHEPELGCLCMDRICPLGRL